MDPHTATSLQAAWVIALVAPLGLLAMIATIVRGMGATASVRSPARALREQPEALAMAAQGHARADIPRARQPASQDLELLARLRSDR